MCLLGYHRWALQGPKLGNIADARNFITELLALDPADMAAVVKMAEVKRADLIICSCEMRYVGECDEKDARGRPVKFACKKCGVFLFESIHFHKRADEDQI